VGIPTTDWLKNPHTALFTLGAIGILQAIGLNMVLLLAGLKAIPRDLYEAAAIDGADGAFERFRWRLRASPPRPRSWAAYPDHRPRLLPGRRCSAVSRQA